MQTEERLNEIALIRESGGGEEKVYRLKQEATTTEEDSQTTQQNLKHHSEVRCITSFRSCSRVCELAFVLQGFLYLLRVVVGAVTGFDAIHQAFCDLAVRQGLRFLNGCDWPTYCPVLCCHAM